MPSVIVAPPHRPHLPPGWSHYTLTADRLAPLAWFMSGSDLALTGDHLCAVNGRMVPADEIGLRWLMPGDQVEIWLRPMGGGIGRLIGKLVLTAVSLVVAAIPGVGPFLAAAVQVVGNLALNALFPPPKPPRLNLSSDGESQNVLPNLQLRQNVARLGSPIPEVFGRHLWFPDLAGPAFYDYPDGVQRLTYPLAASMGEIEVETARMGELEIYANGEVTVDGVEIEILPPGTPSLLYPDYVDVNTSVVGVQLIYDVSLAWGPSYYVGSETQGVTALEVNLEFPQGLGRINSDGKTVKHSVHVQIRYREVDDTNVALGSYAYLVDEELEASELRKAVRFTRTVPGLTRGRYEVNARILDEQDYADTRIRNDSLWTGLRGFSSGQFSDDEATIIIVRIEQTSSIAASTQSRFNITATRKLPHWEAGTGWTAPQTTRSIAAGISHLLRSENLVGYGYSNERIDIAKLWALETTWAARGDKLDGILDERRDWRELLDEMLRVGRAKHIDLGGYITFWRDEPQTVPSHTFHGGNIRKGSFRYHYRAPQPSDADYLLIQYFDPDAGDQQPTILVSATGGTGASGEVQGGPVRFPWVSQLTQARQMALHMHAEFHYRRKRFTVGVEDEGKMVVQGQLIPVSHPMLGLGQFAHVVNLETDGGTYLVLDRPMDWGGSDHEVQVTAPDGSVWGPVAVTREATATSVGERLLLDAAELAATETATGLTVAEVLELGTNRNRPSLVFGAEGELTADCIVIKAEAEEDGWTVELFADDARVYTAEDLHGAQPDLPPTTGKSAPAIVSFAITVDPEDYRNRIVSIQPHPDARIYVVRMTYADGERPKPVSSTVPEIPIRVRAGELRVEAWAIGDIAGPRLVKDIVVQHDENETAPPDSALPQPVTGLRRFDSTGQFDIAAPSVIWDDANDADTWTAKLIVAGTVEDTKAGLTSPAVDWTEAEIIALGGPWPGNIIEVIAVNTAGNSEPARIRLGAQPPPVVDSIEARGTLTDVLVKWTPAVDDGLFRHALKWSTTAGFDPAISGHTIRELVSSPTWFTAGGDGGFTVYVAMGSYDSSFGYNPAEMQWSALSSVFVPLADYEQA